MSLKELNITKEYRSSHGNIVNDFYIPILQESISYKRAVGFFSSTALIEISKGISGLIKNGGLIQIVASPILSDNDIEAMKKGYALRDKIIKNAVLRTLLETNNHFEIERLNLLAHLIADNKLDIKIALTEDSNNFGMYHEKMGIFCDEKNNKIAFSGSMNESSNAFHSNYESIDVFCDWLSQEEKERVEAKTDAFLRIWNNTEKNITIVDFPELKDEIINRYKRHQPNYNIDETERDENVFQNTIISSNYPKIPNNINLHDYQISAIDVWSSSDYRGIFDMATGTGKTFTGLGAIVRLCEAINNKLATFIVCPFQHLVEQWVEDIRQFNIRPIIGYSASPQKDWLKRLEYAIRDQRLKINGRDFFCFICTNATFSSTKVQTLLENLQGNALLLVDEAHNFGADRLSQLLTEKYNYRLALSATIDRHNDENGTSKLYSYFGKKCIEYTLDRAINEGKLTRYKYYPIITTLNNDELTIYTDLTIQIGKCLVKGKDGKTRLNERGKKLALKRARLVAGINDKLKKLEENIQPYIHENHLLVYCGAARIIKDNKDCSETDQEDIRQIDAVTNLLGNKLSMRISQFTSKEDITEREDLKREFANGTNLQALIAIKCLDEGVNIPAIKTAFILASTTNPKEYIQRRGRVLRLYAGKAYAAIYDFIAIPHPLDEVSSLTNEELQRGIRLVINELARAKEFARIAMNMGEAEHIIDDIKRAYSINDYNITFKEDCDYVE